jgi:peptidoglycan hydrolase-like protein with peptidoglycan-binding domain
LRHRHSSFVIVLLLPLLLQGGQSQSTSAKGSTGNQTSQSKTTSSTSKKTTTAPKSSAKKPAARRAAPVPIGQARPTRDRYREIQQALADAGFYSEAIDGIWGERSEAALKRYQEAQDLEPTGKLDALTLIRLGLGPKYETPENASTSSADTPG